MKKLLSVLLLAVMTVTMFTACGPSNGGNESESAQNVSSDGSTDTVILGCDVNFAPMAFKEGDEIVGFDIDLAKAVFEKMGRDLEVQAIDWTSKEAELDTEKVDVIWNGLTITDERKQNMCISEPYMENKQVVVVPSDSDIATPDDLAGKIVGMQQESTAVEAFADSGIQAAQTVELKDNVLCLSELNMGTIDAVVMDSVVADYYLAKQPDIYDFKILDEALSNELYGIAVKKGNDAFMAEIEEALNELIADGTAAEISEEWFGSDRIYRAE